jgi:hypothetical protein
LDLLFIENVGNLICPAEFPLGAHERVVVVSVTEGEYMIKKKNDIFRAAEVNVKKLEFVAKTYDKFYAPHPLLLKMVKERTGKEIDINSQETDDPNVFRISSVFSQNLSGALSFSPKSWNSAFRRSPKFLA